MYSQDVGESQQPGGTSPRQPRQARAQQTRAHIVEVAARTFAETGFAGTSLNEIIRASGLTKGAFYFHFSSKHALALAAFRAKQVELITRMQQEAGEQPSALLQLAALLRVRARLFEADHSLRCVLRLGSELTSHEDPGSEYAGFQETAIALFAGLLARGQTEGSIRADLDRRATAEAIFAAVIGLDELSRLMAGSTDIAARTDAMLTLLLPGLAAPSTPPR